LLHPVMPFITEELWGHLPGDSEELLASSAWPTRDMSYLDDEAEQQFALVQAVVSGVRTIRAEYHVPPGAVLQAEIAPATPAALQAVNAEQQTVQRLAKISELSIVEKAEGVGGHAVLPDGSAVFVPLGDAIDVQQECARLRGELDRLDGQLERVTKKLANEQFVSRAPAEVVDREREKEQTWREQCDTLAAKLGALGC